MLAGGGRQRDPPALPPDRQADDAAEHDRGQEAVDQYRAVAHAAAQLGDGHQEVGLVHLDPVQLGADRFGRVDDVTEQAAAIAGHQLHAPIDDLGLLDTRHLAAPLGQQGQVAGGSDPHDRRGTDSLDELLARALRDQAPGVDDADAVAEALGLLHVVGRVEDGETLPLQGLHRLEDGVAALWVDADRRFVEDEQPRLVKQARRYVQPPLHASRVTVHGLGGPVGQADRRQDLIDAPRKVAP